MAPRFGTDGIRGVAGTELTPELALRVGRAAARVLRPPACIVARDPRRSGGALQAAFVAGVAAEGVDVILEGVLPTPAVAELARQRGWAGAMVSASHNPYADNGLKLFALGGRKLSDAEQAEIERELLVELDAASMPSGAGIGTVTSVEGSVDAYLAHLVAVLDGRRLDGLRVVVDQANGATSGLDVVFGQVGASVERLHAEPDGCNINDHCGATHPASLQAAVVRSGADAGLALDGDGDRVIAVDERGELVDGDHIIAICAIDLQRRGLLRGGAVAVTVMTNLGFRQSMERNGIAVVETAVGDRAILDALATQGLSLGGEQSGHVVFAEHATTGDGLLTGLVLLDVMHRTVRPLSVLAAEAMRRLPQVLVNVRVTAVPPDLVEVLAAPIAAAEGRLGTRGRILVRASGTEPLVRVMVEAEDQRLAHEVADGLADRVRAMVEGPG